MQAPDFWDDPEKSNQKMREAKSLKDVVDTMNKLSGQYDDILTLIEMGYEDNDPAIIPDIEEELNQFKETFENIRISTLLSGEYDRNNAILKLNAGAGGTESCDWCSMLYRMYTRWAERKGFTLDVIDYLDGDEAGIKSVTFQINGENAYGYLKSEKGVHRLVRISPFNAQGKRQTSFVSLDVMPDIEEDVDVEIRDEDIRVDTYRSMPSLNMCGFLYTGADLGGFGADATEDLLLRWLALGIFTPLMRNHSALRTREQEAYRFENMDGFKHIIGLRYRLLPYIYSEYMKAALRDEMMFRPLAFDYPQDARAATVEDQLLVGDGMMIAPVYEQNTEGRTVYLPERMKLARFKKGGVMEEEILKAGHHYVEVGLTDVVIFVRPNHLIPLSTGGQCVAEVDFEDLHYLTFADGGEATYEYYHDNGIEKDYDNPAHITILRA